MVLFFACLLLQLWYPRPYDVLMCGRDIFLLIIAVDVVLGPLLTFFVYDVRKSKKELFCDVGFVICLQILALSYGLYSVAQARPVFLAYEGDRFQVVSVADIDMDLIDLAPPSLQALSFLGPKLVGVRLLQPDDEGYVESIQLALRGSAPSFRPGRWVEFEKVSGEVIDKAKPLSALLSHYPRRERSIEEKVRISGYEVKELGYYPVLSYSGLDFVVVVSLDSGYPLFFIDVNGWF